MTDEEIVERLGFTPEDWAIFRGCDRALIYSTVPCSTRCWKRGYPVPLVNGTCPVCGKTWTSEEVAEWAQ